MGDCGIADLSLKMESIVRESASPRNTNVATGAEI
jgi:hypothetical protein